MNNFTFHKGVKAYCRKGGDLKWGMYRYILSAGTDSSDLCSYENYDVFL